MNYSIYNANRRTHLKIVVLGLLGAILGCRLIKSTIQEQRPDRQRPSNFAPVCRSGWRCA